MGNCEVGPIKEVSAEKPVLSTSSSLVTEVQAMQKCGVKTVKSTVDYSSGYLDLSDAQVIDKKLNEQGACSYGHFGEKPEKASFPMKKLAQDFAPIQTLTPYAGAIVDRVDTNSDGNMTNREITSALNGDSLNEKEKHMLKLLQKNKNSIDGDRNGISMSEVKEFDAKIIQYQNDLMMARKLAPELGELARTLHMRGKLADDNHDRRFSKEELESFYLELKKDYVANPSEEAKRDLNAIHWGIANYERYRQNGSGGGQINVNWLHTQMLREMRTEAPAEMRQNFLSQRDQLRVERYRASL